MVDLPLILVINMARDVARWQSISSALTALELPFTRVRGINARRHWRLVRARVPRPYVSVVQGRPLAPGECCAVLSHLAALKRVVRTQAPWAIVLKDDAEFAPGFKAFVTGALPEFLRHCDIVKFEGLHASYTSVTGPRLTSHALADLIVPLHPTLGLAAYAVTQRGARRLCTALASVTDPNDHLINYYERHWIAYGETRPLLAWQTGFPSNVLPELQTIPDVRTISLPLGMRLRHHRVTRGMVRLGLAAWWVGRARLRAAGDHLYPWGRRPAAYRLDPQIRRAWLAARWLMRARLRRMFRYRT
jgi:glycosyl transferase family 25